MNNKNLNGFYNQLHKYEKRKMKEIIASLENDIEAIKSDGIEEFNRKKRIIKRLNDLKAQFDALNKD